MNRSTTGFKRMLRTSDGCRSTFLIITFFSADHINSCLMHYRFLKLLFVIILIAGNTFLYCQQRVQYLNTRFDSLSFIRVKKTLAALPIDLYTKRNFKQDQQYLPYRLLLPQNPDRNRKYPLVITLHNSSRIGTDNEKQLEPLALIWLRPEIRRRFPAYVLAPQFEERSSNYTPDPVRNILTAHPSAAVQTLIKLVLQLKQELNIDEQRIYLVGYSMGASTAQNLMSLRPDLFAAVVSIAAVPDVSDLQALKTRPIWLIHGDKDDENPFEGSQVLLNALKSGGQAKFTIYTDYNHHTIPFPFLTGTAIPQWLFKRKNNSVRTDTF